MLNIFGELSVASGAGITFRPIYSGTELSGPISFVVASATTLDVSPEDTSSTIDTSMATAAGSGTWTVDYGTTSDNDITLTFTPTEAVVPEPGTYLLMGSFLIFTSLSRKRKRIERAM